MELPCNGAPTDNWLRKYICHAVPELTRPDLSDDIRVSALRRWLYRNVCAADAETVLHNTTGDLYQVSPAEVLLNSLTYSAGCFCGDAAEVARKIFELFGWRACYYDMGQSLSAVTHATTLVEIIHAGCKRVTVQDTYFGFTLRYSDGSPVDFSDLQIRLASGDTDGINLESGADLKWLLYGPEKDVRSVMRHYGFCCQKVIRKSHLQVVQSEWHLPGFLKGEPHFGNFLRQQHGCLDPLWMFMWPIYITPNDLGSELIAHLPSSPAMACV